MAHGPQGADERRDPPLSRDRRLRQLPRPGAPTVRARGVHPSLRGAPWNFTEIEQLWARHGVDLLEAWVLAHPGHRPFGWWICEAPEPRRVLRRVELRAGGPSHEEVWWRPRFGCPFLLQVRPARFTGYPTIEAGPTYLERLGLLTEAGRGRVPAEDREPVSINPFCIDDRPVLAKLAPTNRAGRG